MLIKSYGDHLLISYLKMILNQIQDKFLVFILHIFSFTFIRVKKNSNPFFSVSGYTVPI